MHGNHRRVERSSPKSHGDGGAGGGFISVREKTAVGQTGQAIAALEDGQRRERGESRAQVLEPVAAAIVGATFGGHEALQELREVVALDLDPPPWVLAREPQLGLGERLAPLTDAPEQRPVQASGQIVDLLPPLIDGGARAAESATELLELEVGRLGACP